METKELEDRFLCAGGVLHVTAEVLAAFITTKEDAAYWKGRKDEQDTDL